MPTAPPDLTALLAEPDDQQVRTVLRDGDLLDEAGLNLVLDRAEELLHTAPEQARRLAELCDELAREADLGAIRARSAYQRARILAEQGSLAQALEAIEQSRDWWRAAGREVDALRTDLGRMQVLDDLGRHGDAIGVGRELIAALDRPGAADDPIARWIRAAARENLGIAYGLTGQHDLALDAYARAQTDYAELGMQTETARPLANRGVELLALGRPREALQDLARAADIFSTAGDRLFAAQCAGDTAQAHRQLGELTEALRLLEPARIVLDELGAVAEATRLQLALADTCLALGMFAEARDHALATMSTSDESGMSHDAGLAQFVVAQTDLGSGDHERAAHGLARAAELFEHVGDLQMLARTRLAQAEVAQRCGWDVRAGTLLDEAASMLRAGGWRVPLTWAYLRSADAATQIATIAESLDRAAPLVEELRLPDLTYQYELRRGRLERHRGHGAAAEAHFQNAITELDRSSGALPDHVLLTAFRAERHAAHDELVGLLVERGTDGSVAEASRIADDARSRTLVELMADTIGFGPELAGPDRELAEAFADLNATYLALQQAGDPRQRTLLADQAEVLERRVAVVRLRQVGGQADGSDRVAEEPVPPRTTDAVVLAYHVLERDIVVFWIRGDRVVARRLVGALSELRSCSDDLADQWSRISLALGIGLRNTEVLLRSTEATLRAMYKLLVEPLEDLLVPGVDDLRVVLDGRLGVVPFHALHDGRGHLVERWALTVAPTLAAAQADTAPIDLKAPALVVAVADAYAPAVDAEADAVAALLPTARILRGEGATCAEFSAAAPDAQVIHLACHGVFNPPNPLFSRLRLSDRWLTTAEIVQLDLDGALVTLSACESGMHGRALEPVGLGWSFLAAGASGVLVSQWPVHDDAALALMSALYEELATGASPARALQRAQLRIARQYAHPYFWAPFSYLASPRLARGGVHADGIRGGEVRDGGQTDVRRPVGDAR